MSEAEAIPVCHFRFQVDLSFRQVEEHIALIRFVFVIYLRSVMLQSIGERIFINHLLTPGKWDRGSTYRNDDVSVLMMASVG